MCWGGGKPARRLAAVVLSLCLVANLLPMTAFAAESDAPPAISGMCEHVHDEEDCGYIEAVEGADCSHENGDGSYSCAPDRDSGDVSGNDDAPDNADYVCDHSDGCGYVEAVEGADCTHSCELCDPPAETPAVETMPEETLPEETLPEETLPEETLPEETLADKDNSITAVCACDTLCTEGAVNPDCPVCSAQDADLTLCRGVEEEKAAAYEEVVALFEALPSADSITEETTEKQSDELTAQINAALDALNALSDEDFAKFGEEHSDLLQAVAALQAAVAGAVPAPLAGTVVELWHGGSKQSDHATLADAISSAATGDKLVITADINLGTTGVAIDGKSLALDLNGKTITYSGGSYGNAITLYGSAGLTVTDSGTGGRLETTVANGRAIYISSTGTVAISEGTVSATGESGTAIYNSSTGTVAVSGGTVSATEGGYAICNDSAGEVEVSGGEVSVTNGGAAINNNSSGEIKVEGGTVETTGRYGYAIFNYSTGAVTVSGGTVSAANDGVAIDNGSTGKITISDTGKVTSANPSEEYGTIYLCAVPTGATKTVLEITSGTVENTAVNGYAVYFDTGGTGVTADNVTDYYTMAAGATVGRVYPEAAAVVEIIRNGTTTKYATLAAAVQNAQTGDTLKIVANIDLGNGDGVTINGKVLTLDLNGKTITYNGVGIAIKLESGAGLTVTDGGTGGTVSATRGYAINSSGGTVNVTGGTVSATSGCAIKNTGGTVNVTGGTVSATRGYAIYNTGGTVNVSGGTVTASVGDGYAICNGETGVVNISGGTVSATGSNGYAIYNYADADGKIIISGNANVTSANNTAIHNKSGGTVEVTGGTVSSSGQSSSAILNNSTNAVTVSGGTVSATDPFGVAIWNASTGKITISGNAVVTSENTTKGTICLDKVPNPAATVLEITDGMVSNTAATEGYSVYFAAGSVTADNLGSYYRHTGGTVGRVYPEPAATPTVTSVSITPNPAVVQKGGTQQFTATVSGTNNPAQTVSWSLSGAEKPGTSISTGGLLTVAADESAATLTVTATSTVDASKSGTAAVTVQGTALTDAQKLAMAKSAIEAALANLTASNATTAQDILDAANAAALYNVTVAWHSAVGFSKLEATVSENGSIIGRLQLTLNDADDTVLVSKVIARLSADKSALTAAIAAANSAKNGVTVSNGQASSVASGTKFVTTAEMQALNNAIAAAQTVMNNSSVTAAEITDAVNALNSAVAAFHGAIKTGTHTGGSGSSGSPSGGDGSGSSGEGPDGGTAVTPPAEAKPGVPTESEIRVDGTVDGSGSLTVTLPEKAVDEAVQRAEDEARRNGSPDNGITLVLRVQGGGSSAGSVTVNLPKTTQETIIGKKIVNTVIVVDNPEIKIGIDLSAVKSINAQANADVNITATRQDSSKLTGNAKTAVGSRPVFDLKVNYGDGKQITGFDGGSVSVAIPYTPGAGEKAGGVCAVYVDGSGNVQWLTGSVYDAENRVLRFATNHFSAYGVGYQAPADFTDIAGHRAEDDILFAVSRGLLSGTTAATFSPDTAMTRGMLVTALGRLAGADVSGYKQSSFTDVGADACYMGYVEWAVKNGIVKGTTATAFAPDNAVTREQTAVIMANYAKAVGFELPRAHAQNTFADAAHISPWAADSVKAMQMAGVLAGRNGNRFDPQGIATRAGTASMLRRFTELTIDASTAQGWMQNDDGEWMYYENGLPVRNQTKNVGDGNYGFNACGVTPDFPKKKTEDMLKIPQ